MDDYSENYTSQKNSQIYFANKDVLVDFKPFIEELSYEKKTKKIVLETFFSVSVQTDGVESVNRKLTFKVVASDVKEAKENHKKFQKLLRMLTPQMSRNEGQVMKVSVVYVKFNNLIHDYFPTSSTMDYNKVIQSGLECSLKNLDYSPEMDLGFFESGGLIFAKAFTLSMNLKVVSPKNRKVNVQDRTGTGSTNPGKLFGFDVYLD